MGMWRKFLFILLIIGTVLLGFIYYSKIKPKELQTLISPIVQLENKEKPVDEITRIKNEKK